MTPASYEELDDFGGLINSLRAMAGYYEGPGQRVILENGATAIEGLLQERAFLLGQVGEYKRNVLALGNALAELRTQVKAQNDPAPGAA